MTVLEQISNPYLASLVLGLVYGLTFCASACLPYIVSYIAGTGAGFKKGIAITTIYNSGRIVAYAVIGTIVGLLSSTITEEIFIGYQQYSSIAFGIIIIIIGISILRKKMSMPCDCVDQKTTPLGLSRLTTRFDLRAFSMGLTKGLILCPPLIAFLLYSVTLSVVNPTILAILFGLGTAISPLLLLGGATGYFLNKAPLFRKWLSRIGGIALMIMGLSVLISALLEIM
ncbi:sulfite exporter TauE/SafE family protein [Candidatus Bathyarchaeota archaeon]|nr:sulfite exporter TauE/SafE family protein [Candidatus Bathyarchaeota archaeon]